MSCFALKALSACVFLLFCAAPVEVHGQGVFDVIPISADVILHGVSGPQGLAIDETRRVLYVSDSSHHRILRFDNIDTITDTSTPDVIFGQINSSVVLPNQGLTAPSQSSLFSPKAIWVDLSTGTLWVADQQNHRILWWQDAATLKTNAPANGVIGQVDFTTKTSGLTQSKIQNPFCVTVYNNTLWICDSGNRRLVFTLIYFISFAFTLLNNLCIGC